MVRNLIRRKKHRAKTKEDLFGVSYYREWYTEDAVLQYLDPSSGEWTDVETVVDEVEVG